MPLGTVSSAPSIEKSFDIAEKTKSPPISILARVFKVLTRVLKRPARVIVSYEKALFVANINDLAHTLGRVASLVLATGMDDLVANFIVQKVVGNAVITGRVDIVRILCVEIKVADLHIPACER